MIGQNAMRAEITDIYKAAKNHMDKDLLMLDKLNQDELKEVYAEANKMEALMDTFYSGRGLRVESKG